VFICGLGVIDWQKTRGKKSRDTVPLNCFFLLTGNNYFLVGDGARPAEGTTSQPNSM
jgi:hypothetical protein